MAFTFDAVPWVALAALTASAGRLIDEALQHERIRTSSLNLPFGVIALGLVIRGFAAYFLQVAAVIGPVRIGAFGNVPLTPEERLLLFVCAGVLVSVVGFGVASHLKEPQFEDQQLREHESRE